jgi:Leucine-rich repeat (LRR) protein
MFQVVPETRAPFPARPKAPQQTQRGPDLSLAQEVNLDEVSCFDVFPSVRAIRGGLWRRFRRSFQGPDLDAAARKFLPAAVKPGAPWTQELLEKVRLVSADNSGVRDLSGLEACPDVMFVYLTGSQVADLTPLAKLGKLEGVTIRERDFRLEAAGGLEGAYTSGSRAQPGSGPDPAGRADGTSGIELTGNQVSDLKPLEGLKGIHALYLDKNQSTRAGAEVQKFIHVIADGQ